MYQFGVVFWGLLGGGGVRGMCITVRIDVYMYTCTRASCTPFSPQAYTHVSHPHKRWHPTNKNKNTHNHDGTPTHTHTHTTQTRTSPAAERLVTSVVRRYEAMAVLPAKMGAQKTHTCMHTWHCVCWGAWGGGVTRGIVCVGGRGGEVLIGMVGRWVWLGFKGAGRQHTVRTRP